MPLYFSGMICSENGLALVQIVHRNQGFNSWTLYLSISHRWRWFGNPAGRFLSPSSESPESSDLLQHQQSSTDSEIRSGGERGRGPEPAELR